MKKRLLSLLLTLVMILGMIPATTMTASAASDTTVSSGGALNLTFDYNGYQLSWNRTTEGSTFEVYAIGTFYSDSTGTKVEDVYILDSYNTTNTSYSFIIDLTNRTRTWVEDDYTFTVHEVKDGYILKEDTLVIANFSPVNIGYEFSSGIHSYDNFCNESSAYYGFAVQEFDYNEYFTGELVVKQNRSEITNNYTVSVEGLPSWLTMDANGKIYGQPPAEENTLNVTVTVVYGNHIKTLDMEWNFTVPSDDSDPNRVKITEVHLNKLPPEPEYGKTFASFGFIYDSFYYLSNRVEYLTNANGEKLDNPWYGDREGDDLDEYGVNVRATLYNMKTNQPLASSDYIKVGCYAYKYVMTPYNVFTLADDIKLYSPDGELLVTGNNQFGKVFYIWDNEAKPEIHSVSVNGTSVADGASYNSNSKNVTIKTTYDSTLSAAMLEYGCTNVKALSQWYVNGVKVNKAAVSPVDNGDGTATKTLTHTLNSGDVLEIRNWLEVTWPDGSKDVVDERTTNVTYSGVKSVSVSATFSGTPANATSKTDGVKVTNTKWYKWVESGSTAGYVEMSASDTIKEGALYKCEVTVAEDGDKLASGYTVKINGHEAEKKYGTNHTWVYETRLEGTTSYVDVDDIDLPEAYTNPDFTYNDEEGAAYHWDVVQVEWFECDKDGHKLSDALPADYIFLTDSYYRVEVTVTPESNWQFHSSDLGFYINGKAAQYLYYYNSDYSNSVTGYVVYNTADMEGDYELFVYDDSLSGSAKNIYIKDGQYLGSDATAPSDTEPSGGYAYYKDGVLELNGYDNEKAHFIFEEAALELWLIGDNTIGAIYDNELGMGGNLETRQGNLVINANPGGTLVIASNPLDAFANIQVKDLYFKGGDVTSCLANGTYGAAVQLNGDNLYLETGTAAYVSDNSDFSTATKWDGTTDISTYDCVWLKTIGTCRVDFIDDDNTVLDMVRVTEGSTVSEPDAPVKDGYKFLGWYTDDGDKFDFSTPITEDIYLTARFEQNEPEYIDTIHIEGLPAPQYGQVVKDLYKVLEVAWETGTFKYSHADKLVCDDWDFQDSNHQHYAWDSTDTIAEGSYYWAIYFNRKAGYAFADDLTVTVDGVNNANIAIEYDGDDWAIVYVKYEVTNPAEPPVGAITVNCIGDIDYTVSGNVVTVDHEVACKVGYLDGTAYKAITAVANGDGTYSFTAPAGVTEVLLVVKGDVSGDGFVTVADKMPVARSLLLTTHPAYQALNTIQTFAGDMDNNGSVIVADKMTLARSMLLTTHPAYQALTW